MGTHALRDRLDRKALGAVPAAIIRRISIHAGAYPMKTRTSERTHEAVTP